MTGKDAGPLDRIAVADIRAPRPAVDARARTQAWLLTFTDLVALMLAFFVMLFAMSKVELRTWQNLTDALAEELNAVRQFTVALPSERLDIEDVTAAPGVDLDYLAVLLEQNMAGDPQLERGLLRRLGGRLVISLPGDLFFEVGATEVSPSGRRAVGALGSLLRHFGNRVEVLGHADPRPIDGADSNWELSLARAVEVARLLAQGGFRGPLSARGFGHSRYGALSPQLDAAQRLALGRRVELVVHELAAESRR